MIRSTRSLHRSSEVACHTVCTGDIYRTVRVLACQDSVHGGVLHVLDLFSDTHLLPRNLPVNGERLHALGGERRGPKSYCRKIKEK